MRLLCAMVVMTPAVLLGAGPAKGQARTPGSAVPGDAEIQRAIQTKLSKSKLARNNFQVRVQGGVATLEGTTDVVQHKGAATRIARNAGAKSVVNHIKVSEAARKQASEKLAKVRRATIRAPASPNP